MPKVQLPSGRTVFVRVKHVNVKKQYADGKFVVVPGIKEVAPPEEKKALRLSPGDMILKGTEIKIFEGEEREKSIAESLSVCSLDDMYCKRVGRQVAGRRIMKEIAQGELISRQDRGEIIKVICPELFMTNEDRLLKNYKIIRARLEKKTDSPMTMTTEQRMRHVYELLRARFEPKPEKELKVANG